ncbi:hypothetical protein ABTE21_21225, partial [Acinetobacter baumannii]
MATSDRVSDGFSGSIETTFRHKFKKRGRNYSIAFNPSRNTNDGNGYNYSINRFFNTPTPY